MSSSLHFLICFLSVFLLLYRSEPATISKAITALVLPVQKDGATSLHVTKIQKRTPLLPIPFLVDLNGRSLWVNCEQHYLSSTYHAPRCHSTQCSRANARYCHTCASPARPGCHNNTCALMSVNPVTQRRAISELAQDVLSIQLTHGSNPGPRVTVPQFIFACAPSSLLQGGLSKEVRGVAGLGHSPIALSTQLASYFGFQPTFALCLSSSVKNGVIFFGGGPYNLSPGINVLQPVGRTPLTVSPEGEYYIQVQSIRINGKPVPLNTSLLYTDKHGNGGTMISTTDPYTLLENSIYNAVIKFYANQFYGVPQVKPISPFGLCFDSRNISNTRVGPGVPSIDFVLHNRNVSWRIFGANSMVYARPSVLCLGFVNAGLKTRASIVIGLHQLEDNLLQFDLGRSRLGFSSSLLFRRTTCANFNFTSTI